MRALPTFISQDPSRKEKDSIGGEFNKGLFEVNLTMDNPIL